MKKKNLVLLFAIFVLAYYLRTLFLPDLSLTFGYDQARDAFISQQILGGDIKILGPSASTPGLYHGVFYYYFIFPAYLFGNNPINAAYWAALFNAAVVFIVYHLAYLMTKERKAGFLAAFLFAISFEATQYATWLSNPTLAVWTVPLMYLGLWAWASEKKRWGPAITALGLGLSVQSELFLLYHMVPLVIWLTIAKVKRKDVVKFILVLLLTLSTMILAEIKFGFKSLGGIRQLMMGSEPNLAYAKSIGDYLILYLNQIGRIFSFNSYPGNIGYGGAFVIVLAGSALALARKSKKKMHWGPFLASWLFSHITVVTVGGASTPFLMAGIGPAVSLIIAIFLYSWWERGKKIIVVMIVGILVFSNISMIFKENPRGATLFAIQKDMLLGKQLKAIDYTYQEAAGEPFSVNTLTSPLWINIVWTYLYESHGQTEYGYLPCFSGRDQIGQLAALPTCDKEEDIHFLILEPMGGIPVRYLDETIDSEDAKTIVLDEVYFGELRVQRR